MTEAEQTAVDKLPTAVQPWGHLANFVFEKVHQAGMLGCAVALLAGGVYYVRPMLDQFVEGQKKTQEGLAKLTKHQEEVAAEAVPLLREATQAIPLLRKISKEAEVGNQQRHDDLTKKAD